MIILSNSKDKMQEKYYSIKDICRAIHCSDGTARSIMKDKPFILLKNKRNFKLEACWPESIVLPACLQFERDRKPPKGCVSIQDAAEQTGLSQGRIRSLVHDGRLVSKPKGNGKMSITKNSLATYLKSREMAEMRKVKQSLGGLRYLFNQLRSAVYSDSDDTTILASDSKALLNSRINAFSTKLEELKELIA